MITLDTVLAGGYLRRIHREILKSTRGNHLTQSLLVKDPTLLADFEFDLQDSLRILSLRVKSGHYAPRRTRTVQAVKSLGLRRPLSFLEHDDAVILSGLASAAQVGVRSIMDDWVNFGRSDGHQQGRSRPARALSILEPESSNWFLEWMRYRGLLRVVEDSPEPLLVVSDIANFFPSIDLEILQDSVLRQNLLDADASDLIFHLLSAYVPRQAYAARSQLGLPQDPYDASRILAHFYLKPLDLALQPEGRRGLYTRWVDDLAVAVPTELEGERVIARIQEALANLSLAPNTTKTRLISKAQFRREHFERFNGFLDVAQRRTDAGTVDPRFKRTFHQWFERFLREEREGHWLRVLRRFYTQARRLSTGRLEAHAVAHLREFPTEAASILDYLAYRPAFGSSKYIDAVFEMIKRSSELYDDLQLLCYEWLLLAPFENDPVMRARVTLKTFEHFSGAAGFKRPFGAVAGVMCHVVLKFGGRRAMSILFKIFSQSLENDPQFCLNCLYALTADAGLSTQAWNSARHLKEPEIIRLKRFLDAVEANDLKAIGIAMGLVSTAKTDLPHREVVRARALPLIYLLKRVPGAQARLTTLMQQNSVRLGRMPDQDLRDRVLESHF